MPSKQGFITLLPKLMNPSILQNSEQGIFSSHLLIPPSLLPQPLVTPLSGYISHWVVTTGQDPSLVIDRDFLGVQLVSLQAQELVDEWKTNDIHLKTRKPTGYSSCENAWPEQASTPQLTGGRAQVYNGGAWVQSRRGQSSWPHQGPQHFPLLPLESVPFTQKGLANQMERNRAAAVNPRDSELSQSGIQGPGPPACSSLRAWAPRRAAPDPFPLSGPRTEQAVCAGLALLPSASQSKHKPKPQAQPGRTAQAGSSSGGGHCALAPAEEGQHPGPPDPSRDPDQSPEHTLPEARAQKSYNEPSQPREPAPTGPGQVHWGLAGSPHRFLSQGTESWGSGKEELTLPYLRPVGTPPRLTPTLSRSRGHAPEREHCHPALPILSSESQAAPKDLFFQQPLPVGLQPWDLKA